MVTKVSIGTFVTSVTKVNMIKRINGKAINTGTKVTITTTEALVTSVTGNYGNANNDSSHNCKQVLV